MITVIGRSSDLNSEDKLYFPSDDTLLFHSSDYQIPGKVWNGILNWLQNIAEINMNPIDWSILKEEMEDSFRYVMISMQGFFSGKRLPLLMMACMCLSALYLSEEIRIDYKSIAMSSDTFSEFELYQMIIDLVVRTSKRPRRMLPTQSPKKILGMLQRDCMKAEWEYEWEQIRVEIQNLK